MKGNAAHETVAAFMQNKKAAYCTRLFSFNENFRLLRIREKTANRTAVGGADYSVPFLSRKKAKIKRTKGKNFFIDINSYREISDFFVNVGFFWEILNIGKC